MRPFLLACLLVAGAQDPTTIDPCFYFMRLFDSGFRPKTGHGVPNHWGVDGPISTAGRYEDCCQIPEGFLNRWPSDRRKLGKTSHVLDLMGSGFHIKNPDKVDSVTGVRWEAYKPPVDLILGPNEKPPEILGDIFNPETWKRLDTSMVERRIPHFDLVTMVPVGGWPQNTFHNPDQRATAIAYVLSEVSNRMSSDGQFYFTINFPLTRENITKHPILATLVEEIARSTEKRLTLEPVLHSSGEIWGVRGALLPKEQPK